MKVYLQLILLLISSYTYSQGGYVDINAQIFEAGGGTVIWGDYDNDNDLDFFVTGTDFSLSHVSGLYENNNGSFTLLNNNLRNIITIGGDPHAAWGDYDNDGDLDIVVEGKIYNNNNGVFSIASTILSVYSGSIEWGDYDNDGDLDILVTGIDSSVGHHSIIYKNDNGAFIDINAGLIGTGKGSGSWGDYDNDGDLDILLMGGLDNNSNFNGVLNIYENINGSYTIKTQLPGVDYGNAMWGDYDNDNDLDFIVCGNGNNTINSLFSKIYTNTGNGNFVDSGIIIEELGGGGLCYSNWVDFNQDGNLDFMMLGLDSLGKSKTNLYTGDGLGNFTPINHNIINLYAGSFDWGDYDNDNDLELIVCGVHNNNGYAHVTKIYDFDPSFPTLTGFDEESTYIDVNIFPNPISSRSVLKISDNSSLNHTISIYDLHGQLIKQIKTSKKQIELHQKNFAKGLYLIQIHSEEELYHSLKFIVD